MPTSQMDGTLQKITKKKVWRLQTSNNPRIRCWHFSLIVIMIYFTHLAYIPLVVISKENISILLNNLTELYSSPKNSRRCTAITFFVLIYIFYFFGQMLIIIGYCWSIVHKIDHVTFSQVLIYGIIFTLTMMWCIGPIVVTIIIFIDICEHLISWIKDIRYLKFRTFQKQFFVA